MRWPLVLPNVALGVLVLTGRPTVKAGPLVLYQGEPNADDADGKGILTREGDCLYMGSGSGRVLLAFPGRDSWWDEQRQAVRRGRALLRVGEWIEVGGSPIAIAAGEFRWDVPPHPSCDVSAVWLVG